MDTIYNKHYITIDDEERIICAFSDAFKAPSSADICVNEQGGYQFRLYPDGEENPTLFEPEHMIPLYKYESGEVIKRTEAEIEADRAAMPKIAPEPTADELINALLGVEA